VAGNWKMHGTSAWCAELARLVAGFGSHGPVEVLIAPPSTSLPVVRDAVAGSSVRVAAQNMHWAEHGAFTGEVSPLMVAEYAQAILVGHSERRHLFGETDDDVNRKVHAALDHGLEPVVCVGETAVDRDTAATDEVIARQIGAGLEGIRTSEAARLVVAYEPVWAIGTGRACDPEEAGRVAGSIRALLATAFGQAAQSVRILYGGSVNPGNFGRYLASADVDGALVGGASLDAHGFRALVRTAADSLPISP
jgi:triosephosphate isomerase